MKYKGILFTVSVLSAAAALAEEQVDYATEVKPILAAKCFACHAALKQESDLRLDATPLIRKGGVSGPVILAGNATESLLIQKVSAEDIDERMPPEGEGEPLTAEQIAVLAKWIDQGAVAPDESIPPDPSNHWAFQTPTRTELPVRNRDAWIYNQVDAFLAAQHADAGLTPAASAPREMLLRRLYLDLVGLPPTRHELHAFLADDSPRAYERVVDQLLNMPQYGERWGRHWMDIWRYSDWAGFGNEIRYSQRHIWRWRDWIVQSLNADKGYDRMILEMLAADELAPGEEDAIRATGFLARNWYKFDRNAWLDDTIEHTGKAFLGMTFKCAKCHDHKYDPILQHEYYRLRAIFEPYNVRIDRVPGELDVDKNGLARIFDDQLDAATYLFERGDPKQADKGHPLRSATPAILGGEFHAQPVSLPLDSYYPALREFVARDMIAQARAAVAAAETDLNTKKQLVKTAEDHEPSGDDQADRTAAEQDAALAEMKLATEKARIMAIQARVDAERAKHKKGQHTDPPTSERLANRAAQAVGLATLADAHEKLLAARHELRRAQDTAADKGDDKLIHAVKAAQEKVTAAQKALDEAKQTQASSSYPPLGTLYPQTSTGRRLALARWIVDRQNPLTARVAVNHIWLRHFGRPLVENVDDFGLRSPRPPLADLLDYLAVELMDTGWSMKQIHRLIVTSNAYRMSSSVRQDSNRSHDNDQDNRLFWRMNPRRMEAETVRDAVLYVAGSLDLTHGGPDIDHQQGLTIPRRSLYFRHARERQMEFLRAFDPANPRECYRRLESIRPQQAFALVNSSLPLAESRKLAGRLSAARESGRAGDWERGRRGDWETGRLGEGETGRGGDGER